MGLPQEALDRITFPLDLPPRERAERGILLLKSNILGEKLGPPRQDPGAVAAMFDRRRRSADPRVVPPGPTSQWNFPHPDPWYLQLDSGATSATQGRHTPPDL